jgi:hypothetical protein
MWPNCNGELVLPLGPRPGTAFNIIAATYLLRYPENVREPMATILRGRGYWNVDTGPSVGDYGGYHGQYPNPDPWPVDASSSEKQRQWGKHLDELQWWWDHGFAPIEFLHPDGWTFEQTRDFFSPLLQTERARKLLRLVVPSGWEPAHYEWSNATWCLYFQWISAMLPDCVPLVHLVADCDAPVGTDAYEPVAVPNGEAWRRIYAAGCRGWLIQNGPYDNGLNTPELKANFQAQFQTTGYAAETRSVAWHFMGNAGWPKLIQLPDPDDDLLLINGEATAYPGYWNNLPEPTREDVGDAAMAAGAYGYFDSGRQTVGGKKPPPWVL